MLPWAGEWCIHFASFLCYQICLQKRSTYKCTRHQADQVRFLEEAALAVFFPYTAYTISYNGGYSSFLDLSHGIKSCRKGLRKTGRGQGECPPGEGTGPCPPGRSPAPLTNPSDNLIMTTALEGKRPAAAVKNPIGRRRKNPRPALAEFAFSARCAGKEPVGKDIERERKMLPHVSALSRWADEGPHS